MARVVNNFTVAVNNALEKIGRQGEHNVPASQDPMDALLHEYAVASLGEAYFKKRREKAKDAMLGSVSAERLGKLNEAVARVIRTEAGEQLKLAGSEHYTLQCTLKNGASFVDVTALCNELKKKYPSEDVDKALQKATSRRDPTQSFSISQA